MAVLAAVLAVALADVPVSRKEVTSLPGYDKALPSKLWSGFVDGGVPPSGTGTMYYHYVMFEAEENPANAPTVFWYNGGPGASSLFGIFQELGPLFLNADSEKGPKYAKDGIPIPQYNPYTWSKRFNLFAIDSPAPVGFSYCTQFGPSANGTSCGPWTDTDVFKANHKVVTTLLNDIFPELKKNELYITGESYAGIYVPGLVNELLSDMQGLNLKGYAVGDGCMGSKVNGGGGPWYDIMFFGGHGQISNELFYKIRRDCPEADLRHGNLSAHCDEMVARAQLDIGGYFVYDLYDDCPTNMIQEVRMRHQGKGRKWASKYDERLKDYVCSGSAMTDYLARDDVKAAFGIPKDMFFFNADNGHGFSYTANVPDVRVFHKRAVEAGLRVLTYEGDSDACGLSSMGFLQDTYVAFWPTIGLTKNEDWRPWTVAGGSPKAFAAGYAMEWGNRQVAHITIRGSGHMVPLNKPRPASVMINAFVFNTEYPH